MSPTEGLAAKVNNAIFYGIVKLVTLPYHRFFTRITLSPALQIERYAKTGIELDAPDRKHLHLLLRDWKEHKKDELGFVSVASIALSAIVSACLSWPITADSYWLGPAAWYSSLPVSIFGIFIAAQQLSMLSLIGEIPKDEKDVSAEAMARLVHLVLVKLPASQRQDGEADIPARMMELRLSWKAVFVWQMPMMTFGYSFLLFFIGLTIVVLTPLLYDHSGDGFKIAIFYIVACVLAGTAFIYTSLRGYSTIELALEGRQQKDDSSSGAIASSSDVGLRSTAQDNYGRSVKISGVSQIVSKSAN